MVDDTDEEYDGSLPQVGSHHCSEGANKTSAGDSAPMRDFVMSDEENGVCTLLVCV